MIPSGGKGPSGIETGVSEFIDRQMEWPCGYGTCCILKGPFADSAPIIRHAKLTKSWTDSFRRLRPSERYPIERACPNELRSLGISEYRQVFIKPYRLSYRVHAQLIVIYVVADGRRDMQSLLMRRLLDT